MELKKFIDKSWRIYHNGRFKGYITDYGEGYELVIQDKTYDFPKKYLKKGELKQTVQDMLDWDEYEVYSEYKLKQRGFKILS